MFTHFLIPSDGSALSQKAIDGGIALAQVLGARITAYACLPRDQYFAYSEAAVETPADFRARWETDARAHLDAVAQAAHDAGVLCETKMTEHPAPYLGIIEAAQVCGCDVIFMASHGRRGIGSLLIGSETQRVLTHSTIPVVVFR